MKKIIGNMVPYWKSIIVIMVLLFLQAWCDLSLPQYTSDIIDVGIQHNGIQHILPEKMTKEEYKALTLFMTESEVSEFSVLYKETESCFERTIDSEKVLAESDETFLVPVLMRYQIMSLTGAPEANGGVTVTTDAPMSIEAIRDELVKTMDTMGTGMLKSRGIAYAIQCNKDAGVNMGKIQTNYLIVAGIKMLALALLMGALAISISYFASKVGSGIGRDLRARTFKNVVAFSNAEIDKFSTASLITRSTNDIQQIQMISVMLLRMIMYAPIVGIGGIIKVYNTKSGMGWIIALAVVVIMTFVGSLMMITMPKFKLMQKLVDRVNLVSREILTGLPVIRAFSREKEEEKRFDEANSNLTKTMLFTNRIMNFMPSGMMILMNGLSVFIIWVSAHKIDAGTMQVGAMTAFISYAMMIVSSFLMLTMISVMLPRAMVSANRIDEVLKTQTSITEPENPKHITEYAGRIDFNHVNFRYPEAEEDVLSDIHFTALPGQTTAIIGSTGCGKSTLVNLIPRLYDVTGGSITMDGIDIRELSLENLRDKMGFVPQKGVLFSGTIASNLRFGNKEASDEEIAAAASIAQATEFIDEKPDKYESHIAQGGTNVSGGQKQRLSIARAIAKKAKLFIFDDSFSALDLKTDAALRKALNENVKDATVIIVAQRVSTILHADQILVLEDGKIVGKGTHKELLKSCEVYEQIAKSQLSAKELGIEKEA